MMVTTNVMNTFLLVHIVTTNLEQDVIRNPSQRDCVSLADFINQGESCCVTRTLAHMIPS